MVRSAFSREGCWPLTVRMCHHECPVSCHWKKNKEKIFSQSSNNGNDVTLRVPSSRKAVGHLTPYFHFVTVSQNTLSRFQIKNPRRNSSVPSIYMRVTVCAVVAGRGRGCRLRSKYEVRAAVDNIRIAKTTWWYTGFRYIQLEA